MSRTTVRSSSKSSSSSSSYSRTSTSGSSSGYDAAAAARAAEEERKRKKREEYKAVMNVVIETGKKVLDANRDLNSAKRALTLYATGALCESIKNGIEKAQEGIGKIINGINAITEKAKEKIKENGEIIQNENLKPDYDAVRNAGASVGFSCDPARIREEVLKPLQNADSKLKDASTTGAKAKSLEGCENVKNVPSEIDDEKSAIDKIRKEVEQFITYAEEMEKQNIGLVDILGTGLKTMGSWFSGLFNKEENKEENKGVSAMDMLTELNKNSPVQNSFIKKEQDKKATEMVAEKLGVDTNGKTIAEIAKDVSIKIWANEYGVDTKGKEEEEIVEEIAEKAGIITTTTTSSSNKGFGEIPLYNQLDYPHISLGAGNIRSGGCGPTCLSMLGSAATGSIITPDILMQIFPEIGNKYIPGSGVADSVMQDQKILDKLNLQLEGNYYYGEAWTEGKLMEALENGCVAIWRTKNENFTSGGHYIVISGITEDGKILLNDPNGENYDSMNPVLVEGFANGFDPKSFATYGGNFYVYSMKDPISTTTTTKKTESQILDELKVKNSGTQAGGLVNKIAELSGIGTVNFKVTNTKVNNNSTILEKDNANNGTNDVNTSNSNVFDVNITYDNTYIKDDGIIPYSLLEPSSKNNGEPKPLIVWLHGAGQSGMKEESFVNNHYNLTNIISESKLSNFDAYVISPQLKGDYYLKEWSCKKGKEYLTNLLDKFISEHDVDTDNIIIVGGSLGGYGAEYMAENMSDYFSKAVILSSYYTSNKNCSNITIPIKGYVGTSGAGEDPKSIKYMENHFAKKIGEDKLTVIESSHGDLPEVVFNLDEDGNGRSDIIEWMLSDAKINSTTNSNNNSTNTNVNSRTTLNLSSTIGKQNTQNQSNLFGTLFDTLPGYNSFQKVQLEDKIIKSLAEKYGVETKNKPRSVVLNEINTKIIELSQNVKKAGSSISVQNGKTEKYPEVPLYNQKDYEDIILFNQGNVAEDGCGLVAYSMALTYLFDDDENYTIEKLAKKYEGTYSGDWGTDPSLFRETPQEYGLEVKEYYAGKGFVSSNDIVDALKNGQVVIGLIGTRSGLTSSDGGHYVVLTGVTEDGKILVNDPNGNNYDKSSLKDKFKNGFDIKDFSSYGTYWVFPPKDTSQFESSNTTEKIDSPLGEKSNLQELKDDSQSELDRDLNIVEVLKTNTTTENLEIKPNSSNQSSNLDSNTSDKSNADTILNTDKKENLNLFGTLYNLQSSLQTTIQTNNIIKLLANKYGVETTSGNSKKPTSVILNEIKEKASLEIQNTPNDSIDGNVVNSLVNKIQNTIKENNKNIVNQKKDIFGQGITYESGYEKVSDVMAHTYLKPSSTNDGTQKPLIVWLHGGGKKGLKTYSESNYNLAHIIESSELTNIDAYVLSPVLTTHDSSGSWWCNEKTAKKVADLIDKFIAENNIDKNNVVIMGGSEGGRGVQYMADAMPEYFSQAVVLSGYPVYGVDNSESKVPMKGYVGECDDQKSKGYMEKRLADEIGEENVITIEGATHNKLPKILYNIDSDGDGKSDFIQDLFKYLVVESDSKKAEPTKVQINNNSAIIEGLGTDAARDELLDIKQNNANIKEEAIKPSTNNEKEIGNNLNNSLENDSIFVNTQLNDMISDKQVVKLLANKFGVNVGGKTAVAILDEIATRYPSLQQDLEGMKKLININIKFEAETKPSENAQVEMNKDSIMVEGLGTDALKDELIDIKKENANLKEEHDTTITEKFEEKEDNTTEDSKVTSDKNTDKPSSTKPNKENSSTNTETEPNPTVPENTGNSIIECTPDAIIEAAKNANANSHSEYISEILYEAGYLSEKEMNEYREYSVKELCEKFESFGWKKIIETEKLKVGDIIITNNGKEESVQIYAGDNKWYSMDNTSIQQMKKDWTNNTTWYAYRPTKR